jgi:hypothetical protein
MTQQTPEGWYPVDGGNERYWSGTEWTDQTRHAGSGPAAPPPPPPPIGQQPAKKKRRVFLWVFLAVQVLFIILIIAGASSGGDTTDCGTLDAETCKAAGDVGTSIGVFLIIVVWAIVDFFLAVIYGVYRLAKRT